MGMDEGSVKYDPNTGAVAIRTNQPEQQADPFAPSLAWLVATRSSGPHFVASSVVDGWLDVTLPS